MSDPIKEAFAKVKEEIDYLYNELNVLKNLLEDVKNQQTNQHSIQPTLQQTQNSPLQPINSSLNELQPTNQHQIKTNQHIIPTHNNQEEEFKAQNLSFSTGNEGVPTNQPTNQQTNQHPIISTPTLNKGSVNLKIDNLQRVSEIIGSLDELKKEVRFKFKRLTEQEMVVFSTIYQLEEQGLVVDYSLLSQKLGLTEISIRDYIRKIIKKHIPLVKIKEENNKKILLSIPKDLKKIVSLNTILQLRQL